MKKVTPNTKVVVPLLIAIGLKKIMNNLFNRVNCVEIPFNGPRFTWRKSLISNNNLYERLDKGVSSIEWIAKFPQTCQTSFFFFLSSLPSSASFSTQGRIKSTPI